MSATLLDALRTLYPDAVPGIDYFINPEDGGNSISAWYLDVPRPSTSEITDGKAQADLIKAKTAKQAELTTACQTAITAGFNSDALGEPHRYPNGMVDQANLQASVIESLLPNLPADWTTPFTCIEPDQIDAEDWPLRAHTAAQIQQVGADGKRWVIAQRLQLRALAAQLALAADIADVAAIVWVDGDPTAPAQ